MHWRKNKKKPRAGTVVQVMVSHPAPEKPKYQEPSLEEKVEEAIRQVESNMIDGTRAWRYLKCVYTKLSNCKRLPDHLEDLYEKLEEVVTKYNKHDHSDSVDIDAQYMADYREAEEEEDD